MNNPDFQESIAFVHGFDSHGFLTLVDSNGTLRIQQDRPIVGPIERENLLSSGAVIRGVLGQGHAFLGNVKFVSIYNATMKFDLDELVVQHHFEITPSDNWIDNPEFHGVKLEFNTVDIADFVNIRTFSITHEELNRVILYVDEFNSQISANFSSSSEMSGSDRLDGTNLSMHWTSDEYYESMQSRLGPGAVKDYSYVTFELSQIDPPLDLQEAKYAVRAMILFVNICARLDGVTSPRVLFRAKASESEPADVANFSFHHKSVAEPKESANSLTSSYWQALFPLSIDRSGGLTGIQEWVNYLLQRSFLLESLERLAYRSNQDVLTRISSIGMAWEHVAAEFAFPNMKFSTVDVLENRLGALGQGYAFRSDGSDNHAIKFENDANRKRMAEISWGTYNLIKHKQLYSKQPHVDINNIDDLIILADFMTAFLLASCGVAAGCEDFSTEMVRECIVLDPEFAEFPDGESHIVSPPSQSAFMRIVRKCHPDFNNNV